MKNILTFDEYINENYINEEDSVEKDATDEPTEVEAVIGDVIETIDAFVPGKEYSIDGETYIYQGVTNDKYIFNGKDETSVVDVTAEELQVMLDGEQINSVLE